jgi:hypothetical protein
MCKVYCKEEQILLLQKMNALAKKAILFKQGVSHPFVFLVVQEFTC